MLFPIKGRVEGDGGGEGHTDLASDVRVETAKDNIAILELLSLALSHDHLGDVAHGRGLLPPHGILVLLAGGARRSADGVELQEGVLGEEEDEALADGAGASEDA